MKQLSKLCIRKLEYKLLRKVNSLTFCFLGWQGLLTLFRIHISPYLSNKSLGYHKLNLFVI